MSDSTVAIILFLSAVLMCLTVIGGGTVMASRAQTPGQPRD